MTRWLIRTPLPLRQPADQAQRRCALNTSREGRRSAPASCPAPGPRSAQRRAVSSLTSAQALRRSRNMLHVVGQQQQSKKGSVLENAGRSDRYLNFINVYNLTA